MMVDRFGQKGTIQNAITKYDLKKNNGLGWVEFNLGF